MEVLYTSNFQFFKGHSFKKNYDFTLQAIQVWFFLTELTRNVCLCGKNELGQFNTNKYEFFNFIKIYMNKLF